MSGITRGMQPPSRCSLGLSISQRARPGLFGRRVFNTIRVNSDIVSNYTLSPAALSAGGGCKPDPFYSSQQQFGHAELSRSSNALGGAGAPSAGAEQPLACAQGCCGYRSPRAGAGARRELQAWLRVRLQTELPRGGTARSVSQHSVELGSDLPLQAQLTPEPLFRLRDAGLQLGAMENSGT